MAGKVLIVDDEPNIVTSLQFLMRRSGHETAVAGDGNAAVSEAERFRPDLVLLDVSLPGQDGFAVCQALRAASWSEGLRIVMLTAKGRQAEIAKGLEVGADAYVTKPFSTRDLVEQVRRMLGETETETETETEPEPETGA